MAEDVMGTLKDYVTLGFVRERSVSCANARWVRLGAFSAWPESAPYLFATSGDRAATMATCRSSTVRRKAGAGWRSCRIRSCENVV